MNPKALIKALAKLRRLQRKLDRQRRANNPDNYNKDSTVKKGSKTWAYSNKMHQTKRRITKLHARITSIRQEESHRMTSELTDEYGLVCIEDLNVKGMLKNGRLAKHISDAAFYEKRRQLEYKANYKGGYVIAVDQWFPSSKLCSNNGCGYKKLDLDLSDRVWICPECGQENYRDRNAAINIRDEGLRILNGPVLPGSDLNAPTLTQAVGSGVVGESTP
jgi:putative transposase